MLLLEIGVHILTNVSQMCLHYISQCFISMKFLINILSLIFVLEMLVKVPATEEWVLVKDDSQNLSQITRSSITMLKMFKSLTRHKIR